MHTLTNIETDINRNKKTKTKTKTKTKKCIIKCKFCDKTYKSSSLFKRHVSYCKKKPIEISTTPTPLKRETEQVSMIELNRKMNTLLELFHIQSERLKHVEKMLESKNKIIRDKLQWLIDNVASPHCFDNCLNNIVLHREHYDHVTKNGFVKGYCELIEEIIHPYKEMIYSFTTGNKSYIYLNNVDKWVEFTKNHANSLYCRIKQQLIKVALTVELPMNTYLEYNQIIYGTNSQSIDINAKIKTAIHNKTLIGMETLLNKYET